MNSFRKKLVSGLIILAILTPLGLVLPALFKSEQPFGEYNSDKIKKELGYSPKKMKEQENTWKAPAKDYSFGKNEKPTWLNLVFYAGSGLLGLGLIGLLSFWFNKFYRKND